MTGDTAVRTLAKRGKKNRARLTLGQLWQVPTFLVGLLLLVLVAASAPLRRDPDLVDFEETLADLRRSLNHREKSEFLLAPVEKLLARLPEFPQRAGEIHFLAGSVFFNHSEESLDNLALEFRNKALHHLEQARGLGVPQGDQARLDYRLGYLLFKQGTDLKRAMDLLSRSIEGGADDPAQAYGYMVQGYLRLAKPDLDGALLANKKQLTLLVEDGDAIAEARLIRGEILYKKERRHEALDTLALIKKEAPRNIRLRARYLQTRCFEEEGDWDKAIPLWEELVKDPAFIPGGKSRALYSLGLCYINQHFKSPDQALKAWEGLATMPGEEAQAAALRSGDLQILASDPASALKNWTLALTRVRNPQDYQNKLVDLAKAREYFENGFRFLQQNQEYKWAEQVAELYKKLAPPGIAEELFGQAAEALALAHADKAKKAGMSSPKEDVLIRDQFRKAAAAYEHSARDRPGKDQPDLLWKAALCYREARDFAQAATVLEKFVSLNTKEPRLPEAYLVLADSYLEVGKKDKAERNFYECVSFDDSPFGQSARYRLALLKKDQKDLKSALEILTQVKIQGPGLNREVHEKALFELGSLLFQEGQFEKATWELKDACNLYPQNPKVLEAKEKLADSNRILADQQKKILDQKPLDSTPQEKTRLFEKRQAYLKDAWQVYENLADILDKRAKDHPQSLGDRLMLRKALFGAADMLFELSELSEALRRYQILQDRYRRQAEGLIACQRIWRCVAQVGVNQPESFSQFKKAAQKAVKMAQDDLREMDEKSPAFGPGPGIWTKKEWEDWLLWVNHQLNPPPTFSRPTGPLPSDRFGLQNPP